MRLFPFILCLTGSLNHKQILDIFVPFDLGRIFIPHRGTDLYPQAKCSLSYKLFKNMNLGMTHKSQVRPWLMNNILLEITIAFKMFKTRTS